MRMWLAHMLIYGTDSNQWSEMKRTMYFFLPLSHVSCTVGFCLSSPVILRPWNRTSMTSWMISKHHGFVGGIPCSLIVHRRFPYGQQSLWDGVWIQNCVSPTELMWCWVGSYLNPVGRWQLETVVYIAYPLNIRWSPCFVAEQSHCGCRCSACCCCPGCSSTRVCVVVVVVLVLLLTLLLIPQHY